MFVYYAKCIHKFSEKIRALAEMQSYPLSQKTLNAFNTLKKEIQNVILALSLY
uniref:Uncharacterized protein n=1 Tax=Octopus bimaculoides TaxID=37653 RepID=A0A0L8HIC3_OCTBM